ncbi:Ig-like domain-containing protein [Nocardioides astragali]|uniref:Ig-like domain-containing protein n=1 Tax=Nocardioides astragali TaxID=1776736 RepID=A0ABW2N6N0_9ACTN|nr:Ig-like domain-containing protein [Nocardioides astragali]
MSNIIARTGAGAALALVATTMAVPTAQAAVASPSGLSATPEGASVPALAWAPVAKATGYQVQVDNDSSFGSPELSLSTVNFRATPTAALRSGKQFWRVRTVKGSDTSAWREGDPITVSPVSVPVPTAPAGGANLDQPGNPPLLQWLGSPGATSYTVEVDGDSDFVGSKSYSTKATNLVVPDPLGEGDWFWRVTAVKSAGLVSLPSNPLSFNILPLAKPSLVSPTDSVDTKVSDVVLDWEPVPGARAYDVQISDGPTFDPGSTTTASGVQGTRFSPYTTLANDQFWWRVRAIDLNGQATSWAQTNFGFNRVYEHQPQAVHPVGSYSSPAALTSSRPYYEWTPVPQASDYELIVASDLNFSVNSRTCRTSGTTYVPRSANDCGYKSSGTTYWMVRPLDKPYEKTGLPGQFASVPQAIDWTQPSTPPATFDPTAEVQGMKVAVTGGGSGCASTLCDSVPTTPVFSWDPMPGATSYSVYIGQDNKFTTSVLASKSVPISTTNTMLALAHGDQVSALPDSSAGQAYHWYVRACAASGCGPQPISSPFTLGTKAFRKVSPPVTGLSTSSGAGTEISFSWDDYRATNLATPWLGQTGNQSARGYHIEVDNEPSFQAPLLDDQVVDQTTYTAWDRLYPEGTLYWRVQATDSEGQGLTWSTVQALTKESPAVDLQSPGNGATVSGTVPLRWAPQAFAASYTVEVYRNNDRSFSSVNRLFTTTVKTPAYTWTQPIPADPTAYVWRVRRTDATGNPGPWSTPFEFRSLGAAPTLTAPANGSWQPAAGVLFTWTDVPGASAYNVTATSSSGDRLANVSTPGNAYATTKAVATGSYTWSVTALDAAGKTLGTSLNGSFRVDGTPPTIKTMKPGEQATRKSVFVATFSEKVKGVSKKTMRLYQKGKKKPLKAKVAITKGGRKATLKPASRLKRSKTYLIKLTYTRIKDEAGNPLVKPDKWSVTVK